jgi:hypothetical protein
VSTLQRDFDKHYHTYDIIYTHRDLHEPTVEYIYYNNRLIAGYEVLFLKDANFNKQEIGIFLAQDWRRRQAYVTNGLIPVSATFIFVLMQAMDGGLASPWNEVSKLYDTTYVC